MRKVNEERDIEREKWGYAKSKSDNARAEDGTKD